MGSCRHGLVSEENGPPEPRLRGMWSIVRTPDGFRSEIPPEALDNVSATMAPLLHPALRMKWLYNELDVRYLGPLDAPAKKKKRGDGDDRRYLVRN